MLLLPNFFIFGKMVASHGFLRHSLGRVQELFRGPAVPRLIANGFIKSLNKVLHVR